MFSARAAVALRRPPSPAEVGGVWPGLGLLRPMREISPFALLVRSALIFFTLVLLTRAMGKQQVGRLAPFAFAVAISIGTVAAEPLTGGQVSVAEAVVSMTTMAGAWIVFAWLAMRSNWLKDVLGAEPIVLVQAGRALRENLRRARMNLDDLQSQLRLKGAPNIDDVEFAIIEPPGQLSIIRRAQAEPLQARDLGLKTPYSGLPTVLIHDGRVLKKGLRRAGLSEAWLRAELERRGVYDPTSVLLAVLDTQGRLSLSPR